MKQKYIPGRQLVFSFFLLIVLGSLVLSLPISLRPGITLSPVDAAFMATSSVCVTGLAAVEPGRIFSPFGQVVMALLVQLGGLGFATFSVFILVLLGQQVSYRERGAIRDTFGLAAGGQKLIQLVIFVIIFTLAIEIIGSIVFFLIFSREYSPLKSLGLAFFHSISAFNNAGFDIFGNESSLIPYHDDLPLNLMTSLLIIIGGLGFPVLRELCYLRSSGKKLSTHSRIVLSMTAALLVGGTVIFWVAGNTSFMESFFLSVTARTAGFTTVDIRSMPPAVLHGLTLLMYCGASPGSTGGGIKTTTIFALGKSAAQFFTGREPSAFRRAIPSESIRKAHAVLVLSLGSLAIAVLLMSLAEGPGVTLDRLLFEATSAFATVGLSTSLTPTLTSFSKVVLIVLMFVGRLGPLTIASGWNRHQRLTTYLEEPILIG